MDLLHGVGDFFSLDIGTNSMRIVQLSGNQQRGWTLQKYAYVPIDQKLTQDSDRKSTRLNSSHPTTSRMPSYA